LTDKAISVLGQRLDEARTLGRIAQRRSQAGNCDVQAVVEVDEHVIGPKLPAKCIAANHLPWLLEQRCEYLKRLIAEANLVSTLSDLACIEVNLEAVEADYA
jgi:hypothetical protein